MNRILIISFHALPMDTVASYRAKAYCDYFLINNIYPTLITHRWEIDNKRSWIFHKKDATIEIKKFKTHEVIRLPRPDENSSYSFLSLLFNWVKGDFDSHLNNSYLVFKHFIIEHLTKNKYDCILAIYSPHFHLKLAYEINQKFGIPYILDFRDLWDNQVITKSYNATLKKSIQDYFIKFYWKKWLKKSLFFSTTSSKWTHYLEELSNKKGYTIPNGHEINKIEPSESQKEFKLTYFGRIYPDQKIQILIDGIIDFIKINKPVKFKLLLIGIKRTDDFDGLQYIIEKINSKYLEIIDYLPKEELIEFCKNEASMFFLPSFKEDNGQFMVKLYDFIALGKPILAAPKVNSDMEKVISKTNSGVTVDSVESVASHIAEHYNHFLDEGYSKNDSNPVKISEYHRQNQVKLLADLIKGNL